MASIYPDYAYDIFISYRQKDNKYDGWVTEFVSNLKKELEATFKEDITIYFDQNPHDGLLETHDVDESLKDKLKCLIFIPIISQTYCDPKSFAWNDEFLAFKKLATGDQVGLKVKLANGNVTSRILPVRIHELDARDKTLLENEVGPLRAVDFIFKSAGVNRPLRANEDHPNDNLNKTFYRDQLNKTANAIKEIISVVQNPTENSRVGITKATASSPPAKKKLLFAAAILLLLTVSYGAFRYFNKPLTNKSIAVLAFEDLSPRKDQEWFSEGLSDEILNQLANFRELTVIARASSFYFKDKDVPLSEIAGRLNVTHIVQGSIQIIEGHLRVSIQLVQTSDETHLWSKRYERKFEDLFKLQAEIAENLALELLNELDPARNASVLSDKPNNVEAYEYYLKGLSIHFKKFLRTNDDAAFLESERNFLKAISLDPTYAEAYGALADLYDTRTNDGKHDNYLVARDSLAKIGYRINPNSLQVLQTYGYVFSKTKRPNIDSSFFYFNKAFEKAPDNPQVLFSMAAFFSSVGLTKESRKFFSRALDLDPLAVHILIGLGGSHLVFGSFAEAKIYFNKIIEVDSSLVLGHYFLALTTAVEGYPDLARQQLKSWDHLNSADSTLKNFLLAHILAVEGKPEALTRVKAPRIFALLKMKTEFLFQLDSLTLEDRPYGIDHSLNDPDVLKTDKTFDFVRNEEKFKEIVQRLEKHQKEKLEKFEVTLPVLK